MLTSINFIIIYSLYISELCDNAGSEYFIINRIILRQNRDISEY